MVTTWDLLRGGTSNWENRFFYPGLIHRYGQAVLDVGCGTGRLILDYISNGMDIEGVDNSPEMLAICYQKADNLGLKPKLYHQAKESLDLPRKYMTSIVPSSSYQLVTDLDKARQAILWKTIGNCWLGSNDQWMERSCENGKRTGMILKINWNIRKIASKSCAMEKT